MSDPLLTWTPAGLFCPPGEFFIDPHRPVDRAIVTHAHADHARTGSRRYLTSVEGERVLRRRVGPRAEIDTLPFGQELTLGSVRVSLHPAGHILGSSQIRLECQGDVWVVSGDYKVTPDRTCTPFEPVRCRVFITEATFAQPGFHWEDQSNTFEQINHWWRTNQRNGTTSILYAYSLGKAQRVLAGVNPRLGPLYTHPSVHDINQDYRQSGIAIPEAPSTRDVQPPFHWGESLIVAPPSAVQSSWSRQFRTQQTAFASGWMQIPGMAERRGVDRGFVLSDHADWSQLLWAIEETQAERVYVTHGDEATLIRALAERGTFALPLATALDGTSPREFQQRLFSLERDLM